MMGTYWVFFIGMNRKYSQIAISIQQKYESTYLAFPEWIHDQAVLLYELKVNCLQKCVVGRCFT